MHCAQRPLLQSDRELHQGAAKLLIWKLASVFSIPRRTLQHIQ
jgi:hypothetical protein